MRGSCGRLICLARNPRSSSQIATTTAARTTTTNSAFWKNSVTRISATRPTPEAIAAGRSRPARLFLGAGSDGPPSGAGVVSERVAMRVEPREVSDLQQLGLLVLEHLVDVVDVLLGHSVEALLGAG